MLVLMRGVGESIFIGDDVKVTVVAIRRNFARIGFEAPRHIVIDRGERSPLNKDPVLGPNKNPSPRDS